MFDLRRELNVAIEDFIKARFGRKVYSVCSTIKRHVFEEPALRAQVRALATGHNLNDVVSVMLNTFLNGQWIQLARIKPALPPFAEGTPTRLSPQYVLQKMETCSTACTAGCR